MIQTIILLFLLIIKFNWIVNLNTKEIKNYLITLATLLIIWSIFLWFFIFKKQSIMVIKSIILSLNNFLIFWNELIIFLSILIFYKKTNDDYINIITFTLFNCLGELVHQLISIILTNNVYDKIINHNNLIDNLLFSLDNLKFYFELSLYDCKNIYNLIIIIYVRIFIINAINKPHQISYKKIQEFQESNLNIFLMLWIIIGLLLIQNYFLCNLIIIKIQIIMLIILVIYFENIGFQLLFNYLNSEKNYIFFFMIIIILKTYIDINTLFFMIGFGTYLFHICYKFYFNNNKSLNSWE